MPQVVSRTRKQPTMVSLPTEASCPCLLNRVCACTAFQKRARFGNFSEPPPELCSLDPLACTKLQPLRLDIKRQLSARSDRVKSVDMHPTEPWLLSSLYNGQVQVRCRCCLFRGDPSRCALRHLATALISAPVPTQGQAPTCSACGLPQYCAAAGVLPSGARPRAHAKDSLCLSTAPASLCRGHPCNRSGTTSRKR